MIEANFFLGWDAFDLAVELRLPGSGVTALFGPSGSGKTTLLRCIAGLEARSQGQLTVNGERWQDSASGLFVPPHKRPIGYVFQDANLFPHLTVAKNLAYGQKRVDARERRIAQDHAIELLGITHLLERMPNRLSGGERQRVGIARALLTSPRLLLMDEPLAALDYKRKMEILPYLERLHDELDIPILYVSHAPDEVVRLADHLVLMESGRAIASGETSETLARTDLPLALSEDAGVLIKGRVTGHDAAYGLLSVAFDHGQTLRLAHPPRAIGEPLRIRVQARDVSLSLERPTGSSVLNIIPARVMTVAETDNPAHRLVRLDVAGTALLARITRYSLEQLGLCRDMQVWAQIKSVALLG
ncbi:molybdenum ABC transporter ATP-binding protein [Pseudomonas matsuisoli]|uniref:Molybdenum import ATP-binding protein ModC n=1 Tax=Pseudomonas matsuisoli TaxID=1515666 RepID=A0A917UZQ5_9PSED|nr:molybdenum ABC transporter ATP-binding protein [Pseudomonas matsuisoli]GGK04123.1 molybdenum import ATP-binding protein ModC [Pseudomonas matsuisoli]